MAGVTIQQILHQGYAAFERCHPLPASVRKAAWALLVCRTAVLGGHIQVIFTMPDELRGRWLVNVRPMTKLLFATVHETVCELVGDAQYLGARPGISAALHTWSQTLVLHPPLHGLVTGGGLTETGEWRAVRNGLLLPARVVMALFRGKLLATIDTAIRAGQLRWLSRVLSRAFEWLELFMGKLFRAVLRGRGGGNIASLPDLI